MAQHAGRIDAEAAKLFEAHHFDDYLGEEQPGERWLCAHRDLESKPIQQWHEPNLPGGTVDAKSCGYKDGQADEFCGEVGIGLRHGA